ncbi:MAG: endonuclease/exonuclease/phosphatase family protein [Verrucomicrobia bacterium]|nr:endonuclease/exonuclease/phosphatase family protein [Verrucomicrobiota bacterium]MCF7708017.1 endonuclease/exonuclease/phosphatase family protein [Verrucomicrobiota bacterium]
MKRQWISFLIVIASISAGFALNAQNSFTVATFNVENYVDDWNTDRGPKPETSKAKVKRILLNTRADVLALQEIGTTNALLKLRGDLTDSGLEYPYWEHVEGYDTNIFVAVLSRYPITARRPHEDDSYLLHGRRFHISRGFAEVEIELESDYEFTMFVAHLKSKREVYFADQAEMRLEEAELLREYVDSRLEEEPKANIVVVGDLNDTQDSDPIKTLIGRGGTRLVDARPFEKNGDDMPNPDPRYPPRRITWTHYYGVEDTFSRFDYILLSPGMAREWDRERTHIYTTANWGVASDHRMLVAAFKAVDQ